MRNFIYLDKKSLEKQINNVINDKGLARAYAKGIAGQFQDTSNLTVNLNDTKVDLTWKLMQNLNESKGNKFLDMKQYFARSPKAKRKKNGGWYLIVPIGVKAREAKANAPRSLWNQISHMDFGSTGELASGDTNHLASLGNSQQGVMSPLQYQWKSSNITRVAPKSGKGTRGRYISFRTVSDRSDPSSWIIGRQTFNEDDEALTPDMKDAIRAKLMQQVANYKVGNLDLLGKG